MIHNWNCIKLSAALCQRGALDMSLLLHYHFWGTTVISFVNAFVFDLYLPFFTSPIIHLLVCPPNLCMEPSFVFLLRTVVPREIKDKAYAKLGGGGGVVKAYPSLLFDKQTPEITVSSLFLCHFLEYVSRQNWLNMFCMVSFLPDTWGWKDWNRDPGNELWYLVFIHHLAHFRSSF